MPTDPPSFATFWAGRQLTAYEQACIASFVAKGYAYTVYSYGDVDNLPEGVSLRDAGEITDGANMRRFLIRGRPNLSHFSDLFRYELFRRTDAIWVDTDMLMLRPFDLPSHATLLAKEDANTLCGAILRLDRNHPALGTLIDKTHALRDQELVWGATGPRLLTSVFGRAEIMRRAYAPGRFFPIHYDASWKAFLPEACGECERLSADALTTHLWNDRVVKIGIWKRFAPPAGSFLHERFREDGSLGFFEGAYPEDVMRNMIENWRFRCEGGDIGLGQWMRRALPSAQLTFRRRMNLPT